MKQLLIAIPLLALCGCALMRPNGLRRSHTVTTFDASGRTNSVTVDLLERVSLPALATWPADQSIAKQRGSVGKTVSAGVTDAEQQGGGTNLVDALRAIGGILGNLRP
jgi:hypothetical protein